MRQNRVLASVMALVMVLQFAGAQELPHEVPKPPRPVIHLAEFGAGLGGFATAAALGSGVAFGGLYLFVFGLALAFGGFPPGLLLTIPGAVLCTAGSLVALGSPVAGAYCASAVGNRWREGGSVPGAVFCAYVGLVPGAGIGYVGYRLCEYQGAGAGWPFYLAGAACVVAGATLGYNFGIPDRRAAGSLGGRLEPPGVTFTSTELPDRSVEYGVRVQLASLRF